MEIASLPYYTGYRMELISSILDKHDHGDRFLLYYIYCRLGLNNVVSITVQYIWKYFSLLI